MNDEDHDVRDSQAEEDQAAVIYQSVVDALARVLLEIFGDSLRLTLPQAGQLSSDVITRLAHYGVQLLTEDEIEALETRAYGADPDA